MYKIPVSEEEQTVVGNIEQKWKGLFLQAKDVDRSLVRVKKKFTKVAISSLRVNFCYNSTFEKLPIFQ